MGFLSKLGEGIAGQVRVWFGKPRIIFKEALVMERVYKKLAHQKYGVGGVRGRAITSAKRIFAATALRPIAMTCRVIMIFSALLSLKLYRKFMKTTLKQMQIL